MNMNRNIVGVGVDTLSTDSGQGSKTLDAHKIFGGANVWGMENMANLESLPVTGHTVFNMVQKIRDGSGGASRWDRYFVVQGDTEEW